MLYKKMINSLVKLFLKFLFPKETKPNRNKYVVLVSGKPIFYAETIDRAKSFVKDEFIKIEYEQRKFPKFRTRESLRWKSFRSFFKIKKLL